MNTIVKKYRNWEKLHEIMIILNNVMCKKWIFSGENSIQNPAEFHYNGTIRCELHRAAAIRIRRKSYDEKTYFKSFSGSSHGGKSGGMRRLPDSRNTVSYTHLGWFRQAPALTDIWHWKERHLFLRKTNQSQAVWHQEEEAGAYRGYRSCGREDTRKSLRR